MHAAPIMIVVLCALALAYRYYSAFLAAKVAVLDDSRVTPAIRLNDGHNYHPTSKWVLFGHHFATVVRSLYDGSGQNFVGLSNYKAIFSTTDIIVSLKNNVVWVVLFPFLVTFFGLVFAVLIERIRWSTAFK